jgi:hypothetical protein
LRNFFVWLAVFSTLAFGLIGFTDDYLKVRRRRSLGLSGRWKMLGLVLITIGVGWVVTKVGYLDTEIYFPIVDVNIDLGWFYFPFLFIVIWTSQHWILATGLASQTPSGEPVPAGGDVRRVFHALNARPWAILLVVMVSSILLLPFFEVEANRHGDTYYGDRIFGAVAEGLRTSLWVPALVAAGFATGFVHYLLDRSVYRMSDPRIRSAACGLLDRPCKLRAPSRARSRRSGQ